MVRSRWEASWETDAVVQARNGGILNLMVAVVIEK